MTINLTVLTRQQLVSQMLQLIRENKCLNTELLRSKLICKYYDKLCDVLETNHDFLKQNNNKELIQQINTLKALKICEIKLNLLENDDNILENNTLTNVSQNYITIYENKEQELFIGGVSDDNLNINDLDKKHNELDENIIADNCSENDDNDTINSSFSVNEDINDNSDNDSDISDNFREIKRKTNKINKRKFICEWIGCGKIFTSNRGLKGHLKLHNNIERRWKCEFDGCGYTCLTKSKLSRHALKHTKELKFKCNYCDAFLKTRLSLRNHKLRTHPELYPNVKYLKCDFDGCSYSTKLMRAFKYHKSGHLLPFKCNICNTRYRNKFELKEHNKIKHGPKVQYMCEFAGCGKIYYSNVGLKGHLMLHNKIDSRWKCEFVGCGYTCLTKSRLLVHTLSHSKEKKFKCNYNSCDTSLKTRNSLLQHKLRTHPELFPNKETLKCDFDGCSFSTKFPRALRVHESSHLLSFKCNFCNNGYRNQTRLNEHISSKHIGPKTHYICEFADCGRIFPWLNALKQHEITHKDRTIKCDWPLCDKMFKTKTDLNIHVKKRHKNVVPKQIFACNWDNCGKIFSKSVRLNDHMNSHTGNKPYACEWPGCDKCFGNDINLKIHMNNHKYTGKDRLYHCSWPGCEFSTNHPYNIQTHTDIHKGIKNFVCEWPQCDYRSARKANLQTHIQKIHKRL